MQCAGDARIRATILKKLNLTFKNTPDRQQCVGFRNSPKVQNQSLHTSEEVLVHYVSHVWLLCEYALQVLACTYKKVMQIQAHPFTWIRIRLIILRIWTLKSLKN